MEKILLAIDPLNTDTASLEFACYLGRLTHSKVTGVFLENVQALQKPALKHVHGMPHVEWEHDSTSAAYNAVSAQTEKSIAWFKDACTNREVQHCIHRDRGVPVDEMIAESRFADLLIVTAETSFHKDYEGVPTDFVKNILKSAECPVLIAPPSFDSINEVVVAYNGTASCVFAIKQFTYLLPQLHSVPLRIIQFNKNGQWSGNDKHQLTEWLGNHYSNIQLEAVKGEADTGLYELLFRQKNIILVMGAYGRNAVSKLFKPSPADLLVKILTQPVFITHL